MRLDGSFLLIPLMLAGCATGGARLQETVRAPGSYYYSERDLSPEESQALQLINELRAKNHLAKLVISDPLQRAAVRHSQFMASKKVYDHLENGTVDYDDRIRAEGGKYKATAENINCALTPAQAVGSWDASDEHRENLLGADYQAVGISFQGTKEKLTGVPDCTRSAFWTADFGGN